MCDLAIGVCLEMEAEGVADSQIQYVNALSNLEAGLDVLQRFRADGSFIENQLLSAVHQILRGRQLYVAV